MLAWVLRKSFPRCYWGHREVRMYSMWCKFLTTHWHSSRSCYVLHNEHLAGQVCYREGQRMQTAHQTKTTTHCQLLVQFPCWHCRCISKVAAILVPVLVRSLCCYCRSWVSWAPRPSFLNFVSAALVLCLPTGTDKVVQVVYAAECNFNASI